jgi:flap endonuclease-1
MGIQDLTKSIKKYAPEGIKTVKIADLPGTIYAVDVLSYLYPSMYNAGAKGKGPHIRFFFDLYFSWTIAGKNLVMVFDGNTSTVSAKSETLQKRQEVRQKHEDIIAELSTKAAPTSHEMEELEKATRNNIKITSLEISDLKKLFAFLNIPFYQASGEADSVIAHLFNQGVVHGVISEDTDMLTHGVDIVARGLLESENRSMGQVSMYHLTKILEGFGMSMPQFIDFCILSGCDYCARIPGVGPVKSFKHIKDGGTPLTLQLPPEYELKYREACRQFTEHQTDAIKSDAVKVKEDNFKDWLLDTTNMTEKTLLAKFDLLEIN